MSFGSLLGGSKPEPVIIKQPEQPKVKTDPFRGEAADAARKRAAAARSGGKDRFRVDINAPVSGAGLSIPTKRS